METIHIIPSGLSKAYRVWPSPEAIPEGAVTEAREHILELVGSAGADRAELTMEGVPLKPLRSPGPGTARWAWSPGFNAGIAEAELSVQGRRVLLELVTDPAVGKATRSAFDTMVGDILSDTMALLSAGGHRIGLAKGSGDRPPPLARLEYLRSRAERIAATVRAIDASPRRTLTAETESLPYWRARTATGTEIARSLATSRALRDRNEPSVLPEALKGFLPAAISKRVRRSSLDIPEHRAMKACIRLWSDWLGNAADLLANSSPESRKAGAAARLRAASRTLGGLLELPVFDGVGGAPPRPDATPIFRHEPRYREFLRLYEEMALGVAPVFGDFLDLPIARTHDLYELWAFLRLVRAAAEMEGGEVDVTRLFRVTPNSIEMPKEHLEVAVGRFRIAFQKPFGEFWRNGMGVGSVSRTMVPDIVVAVEGQERTVALDAKYRVGDAISDAMTSAHTYRDAIVVSDGGGVRPLLAGSFLLTPHATKVVGDWRDAGVPERFFHPAYKAEFGLGAFTMAPGGGVAEARAVLEGAMTAAGWG